MNQSKTPKAIACTVQVQPGSRAVVIPREIPSDTILTVDGGTIPNGRIPTIGVQGECQGNHKGDHVFFWPTLRTFADCQAGERVMVETAIGWLDGVVQV